MQITQHQWVSYDHMNECKCLNDFIKHILIIYPLDNPRNLQNTINSPNIEVQDLNDNTRSSSQATEEYNQDSL